MKTCLGKIFEMSCHLQTNVWATVSQPRIFIHISYFFLAITASITIDFCSNQFN